MPGSLCRVTITDIEGRTYSVEVKASSLFEAVAEAIKRRKAGSVPTDGFRPIKVMVFEPKKEYAVKLKDFVAWLDRHGRAPCDIVHRLKIKEILGVAKP